LLVSLTRLALGDLRLSLTRLALGDLRLPLTRLALGDLRLPLLRPHSGSPVGPQATDGGAQPPALAAPGPLLPAPSADDEIDAEQAVREHLYGRRAHQR
jgi:hypothetical protein